MKASIYMCSNVITSAIDDGRGYVFTRVCLSVDKISQKVINGLGRNFLGELHMGEGRID